MTPNNQQVTMACIAMVLVLVVIFVVLSFLNNTPKTTAHEHQKMVVSAPSEQSPATDELPDIPEPIKADHIEFAQTEEQKPIVVTSPGYSSPVEETEAPEEMNEPCDVQTILAYVDNISAQYGIDPNLVAAIIECESGFDPNAISKTDDYGLMQINKCNHESLSETLGITDFLDPESNIRAGVYLLSVMKKYADTEEKLLMCYHLGVNGARAKWSDGIVSTSYTQKVLRIKNGE